LANLAPSSQTVGSLLRTPYLAKPARIIWQNGEFGEYTSMEKYAELLFNWRIRQSQKLDKPSSHHLNPFVCSLVLKGDPNLFSQFSSSEKQKDLRTYYPKKSNTNPVSGNSF
jgi:hypothetical protein